MEIGQAENGFGQAALEQFGLSGEWIKNNVGNVNAAEIEAFIQAIISARENTIWVTGAGASGLVGKMIAMRLAQLGFNARVLGEISAGPVKEGDIMVVVSGSGGNFPEIIKEAKYASKAKIILITHSRESAIGRIADITVKIPSEDKENKVGFKQALAERKPIFILNAGFELSALLLSQAAISVIASNLEKTDRDCQSHHARPIVPI